MESLVLPQPQSFVAHVVNYLFVLMGAEPTVESGAGPGREVLLTRLVDQLKGRLQTYKEENQQLEEMLHQSDARASGELAASCCFMNC